MPIAEARLERLPRTQEMLPTSAGSGVIHPSGRQSEGWSPSGGIPIDAPHPIVDKPPNRRADRHLNPPVRIQGGFLWPGSRWIFRQRLSHDGRVRPKVGIGRGRALIPSSGMGAFLYGRVLGQMPQVGCMNKYLGCRANSSGQEIVELSGGIG